MSSPPPGAPRLRYARLAPDASATAPPPDDDARGRIREDLDATLLVEAGAGSGKTTSLIDRMAALVVTGRCEVREIAAVTFTRMAAAELRQRFQLRLEDHLARAEPSSSLAGRLEAAIQEIDAAFLGTIHSFCAKLLRERPLEADLDPGFRELQETEAARAQRTFWTDYLERLAADEDPRLADLARAGIAPERLQDAYNELVEHPDVEFLTETAAFPDADAMEAVRAELNALLDRADLLLPEREPEGGWDDVAKRIRTLLYMRRTLDWNDPTVFFGALQRLHAKNHKPTQKRWADTAAGKAQAKELGLDLTAFAQDGSRADRLLRQWWAWRYPVALAVAGGAADAYATDRRRQGQLTFQDLLVCAADLLRNHPGARRDLGERYRYILVDEFQDTDPLQAEILLLLASDPESNGNDWRAVLPRPGALFVVGDPKQSIYRFRRADITLYEFVKTRFREFGEVLELVSNFRSLGDFGRLVEGVFDCEEGFPRGEGADITILSDHDTIHCDHSADSDDNVTTPREDPVKNRSDITISGGVQASFAPLRTRNEGRGLVAVYPVCGKKQIEVIADDATIIAAEIARRVESGERTPADFMILTQRRRHLGSYARALEDRNLPFEVSGAGIGFEVELAAFLLLFRCLADPEHEVHALGVLTGPFFGIPLDRIVRYRDGKGRFVIDRAPEGECEVADALGTLHRWWERARLESADVTAERLVDEIGLFPLAAAETLGALRAGALSYLLDAVRARALAGDASLAGAVDAMQTALAWDDAEAPLVPDRPDCVRLMNLHRAKGLEAEVVFLAAPLPVNNWPATLHVSREEGGAARGAFPIVARQSFGRSEVIAQPLNWNALAAREEEFAQAEFVRLLYVAATRAKHELWIASSTKNPQRNQRLPWKEIEDWVRKEAARVGQERVWVADPNGTGPNDDEPQEDGDRVRANASRAEEGDELPGLACNAAVLAVLPGGNPPAAAALDPERNLGEGVAAARSALEQSRARSYRLETVTARVKGQAVADEGQQTQQQREMGLQGEFFEATGERPQTGGLEWGNVVHEVLAQAEDLGGVALRNLARDLLVERGRDLDPDGEPVELDTLLGLVAAVRGSELWRRAMASPERYTELPFAVTDMDADAPLPELLEGVIDLVFRDESGWVIADYKTDSGDDPHFGARVAQYRRQVDLYARCWERLTGESVCERILVFTAQGRVESW